MPFRSEAEAWAEERERIARKLAAPTLAERIKAAWSRPVQTRDPFEWIDLADVAPFQGEE